MSLKCIFGATCFLVQGVTITEEQLFHLEEMCSLGINAPLSSFVISNGNYKSGMQMGYLLLEEFDDAGFDVSWYNKNIKNTDIARASHRKREAQRLCQNLRYAEKK